MKCVTKFMAMPGTRTTVADLSMFGLAACDEGGPGFVKASVRTVTNARQVGTRMRSKCAGTHRHTRVNASSRERGTNRNMDTSSCPSSGGEVRVKMLEQKKKAKDAKRIRGIVHENVKSKGTIHVQDEMGTHASR